MMHIGSQTLLCLSTYLIGLYKHVIPSYNGYFIYFIQRETADALTSPRLV